MSVKTCAIILAAGSGSRMKSSTPKQFMQINGSAVLLYSVRAFSGIADKIVLVAGRAWLEETEELLRRENLSIPWEVTEGGENRYDSSEAGLRCAEGYDYVMIHDAARPCVSAAVIRKSLESALIYGSGIASVASKDTVKVADEQGFVVDTPDRRRLYIIQTPQTFRRDLIADAYARMRADTETDYSDITDDASVLERCGRGRVRLSEGDYRNIKITTPEDLLLAGEWISLEKTS